MKLNNFNLISYNENDNIVSFILSEVTFNQCFELDKEDLVIYSNDEEYKRYKGYTILSVGYANENKKNIVVTFMKEIEESSKEVIEAIEQNLSSVYSFAEAAQIQANENTLAIAELGVTTTQASSEQMLGMAEVGTMLSDIIARLEKAGI